MDSKHSARLTHYLEVAQNASSETAADICMTATADPQLFVFSELLNVPSISALQNTPAQNTYRILQLFAHGTVSDYTVNASQFPPLTDAHWTKLRILSLLSLARGRSRLMYDLVRKSLRLDNDVGVEDVVRDAVYAGLVRARMDQRRRAVEISVAMGRDAIVPDGIRDMADMLRAWVSRTDQLVDEIDGKIAFISAQTKIASEQKALASANAENARKIIGLQESSLPRQPATSDMVDDYRQFVDRFSGSARRSARQ